MPEPVQTSSQEIQTPAPPIATEGVKTPNPRLQTEFDGTTESHLEIIRSNAMRQLDDKLFEDKLKTALDTAHESNPGKQGEVNALLQFKDEPNLAPKNILRVANELSIRGASAETLEFLDVQRKAAVEDGSRALFDSTELKQLQATQLQRSGRNDEAVRASNELLARNPEDAEAWRTKAMAMVADAGQDQAKRPAALGTFEEGFAKTGNYSLGMGALNAALETGNIDHAQKLAPLVALSAKNIGADQSKSFWPAMINAEATAVGGTEVEKRAAVLHLVDVLASKDEYGTPLVSDQNKELALERIKKVSGTNPEVTKLLAPVADRLEMSLHIKPEIPLPYQKEENAQTAFTERGYHSRQGLTPEGLAIKGNVRSGSLLPDSSTGIKDKLQFLEVAHTPLGKFVESGLIHAQDLPEGVSGHDSIADIKDVKTRIQATQVLVRGIYDVDDRHLEDLHGTDHKVYDSVVRLRLQHAGATTPLDLTKQEQEAYSLINEKGNESLYRSVVTAEKLPTEERAALDAKLKEIPAFRDMPPGADIAGAAKELIEKAELYKRSDTQTSTAVSAEQGIGDCRQVAGATEAIISVVQQENTNKSITDAARSLGGNDMDGYLQAKQQASKELNGYEMRVYDQAVKAAVEVEKKYEPVKTADGRFVAAADDKPQLIETHMHDVVRVGDKLAVADSFYQKGPYKMGWVENDRPETFSQNGMTMLRLQGGEVDAVVCRRDGEGKLIRDSEGHPIPVLDEAGQPVVIKTPVVLESTKYSSPDKIQLGHSGPDMYLNGAAMTPERNLAEALQDPHRADAYKKLATFALDQHDSGLVHNKEIQTAEQLEAARASLKAGEEPHISDAAARIPPNPSDAIRELERLHKLPSSRAVAPENPRSAPSIPANDRQKSPLAGGPTAPAEHAPKPELSPPPSLQAAPATKENSIAPKPEAKTLETPAAKESMPEFQISTHKVTVPTFDGVVDHGSAGYTTFVQGQQAVKDYNDGHKVGAAVNGASAGAGALALGTTALGKEVKGLGTTGEILGGAVDVYNAGKAYKDAGQQGQNAGEKAAQSVTKAVVSRAAIGAMGIGATSFLTMAENEEAYDETRKAARAKMDAISADNDATFKQLRAAIGTLQTEKDPLTNKPYLSSELATKDAKEVKDGKPVEKVVDLNNESNQHKISAALKREREVLSSTMDKNSEQFVYNAPLIGNVKIHALDNLSSASAISDPESVRRYTDAAIERKQLDVASAELTMQSEKTKFVDGGQEKTAVQIHDDAVAVLAKKGNDLGNGSVPIKNYTFTLERGGLWKSDAFKGNDQNEPLPPEAIKAFKADPVKGRIYEQVLYKRDEDGKPLHDERGKLVVAKVNRFEIIDTEQKRQADLGMTSKEQEQAFGSTWKAERKIEARVKAQTLGNDFSNAAKQLAYDNSDGARTKLVESYEKYREALKYEKENAQALGLEKEDLAKINMSLAKSTIDFNSAFEPQLQAAKQNIAAAQSDQVITPAMTPQAQQRTGMAGHG